MAIEKVYRCDLDGERIANGDVRRVGVRTVEDRPDAAEWVDIGPCCHARPISDLLGRVVEAASG